MNRSDGAKAWARLLSELADVPVTVEWERPAWRVRWRDGPTRDALMTRAAALGAYRVGRPLMVEEMRFSRTDSAQAIALGWLAVGGPPSERLADGMGAVEAFCEATAYPATRFDDRVLGAADLLIRLSGSDHYEMGRLLAGAVPAVPPAAPLPDTGPALRGRTQTRWSRGGPPEELLGPPDVSIPTAGHDADEQGAQMGASRCQHCGQPMNRGGRGRPAKYCSGTCRTAAHRALHAAGSPAGH